jgi:hypothetical protein
MKNAVVSYVKENRRIIYLEPKVYTKKKNEDEKVRERILFDVQHRLRIKSAIYGYMFQTYHPDMDFTIAKDAGWNKNEDLICKPHEPFEGRTRRKLKLKMKNTLICIRDLIPG